jgi:hypothetical protein
MAFLLPFVGEEKRIDLGNANNGRDFKLFIFAYWSLQRSVTDVRVLFDRLYLGRITLKSGPVYAEILAWKVALAQICRPVIRLSPLSSTPPILMHSSITGIT